MSLPVNDHPLPPLAPSQRGNEAESSQSRSTGVRARSDAPGGVVSSQTPIIKEAEAPPHPGRSSIPPESLRKPYASLVPEKKKRSSTEPTRVSGSPTKRSPTGPRPLVDEGPSWDEKSSLSSSLRPSRGICKKHKISRRSDGVCLLCRKEELAHDNGRGWKIIVALMVIAVISGGIVAALV
jgi:hypothetical protein